MRSMHMSESLKLVIDRTGRVAGRSVVLAYDWNKASSRGLMGVMQPASNAARPSIATMPPRLAALLAAPSGLFFCMIASLALAAFF